MVWCAAPTFLSFDIDNVQNGQNCEISPLTRKYERSPQRVNCPMTDKQTERQTNKQTNPYDMKDDSCIKNWNN